MQLKNNLYVISLTHWDREWRFPFRMTRMLLVEIMDDLLRILDSDPEFVCFHLDGQTVLVEDYLAVRPENTQKVVDYVKERRIIIGPWYVLPEENQMSGESLVRNFLWGERLGRRYGGNMKVGYSPTSWGQVSQMPQIMSGFGVESIMFYRGIAAEQIPGNYYVWEGPDGSRLFGVKLGDYARSSYFHLVDRPVVFSRTRKDQSHDWGIGGKPLRVCDSGSITPYHFHHPPTGWYPERIEEAFGEIENVDLGTWETPFALAMEGTDSIGAFELNSKIIREANKLVTNDKKVVQYRLPDAIEEAREFLDEGDLPVVKGEMRHPLRKGVWTDLYAEVQACRIPTKYANRRAEFHLQRVAEPLATAAWTLGVEYPAVYLDDANSMLLQNHAHDSIGGCGMDPVDEDVRYRFRQVDILSENIAETALREVVGRMDTSGIPAETILLMVFNSLPRRRGETVLGEIDIPRDLKVRDFTVQTFEGEDVPVQVLEKDDFLAVFNHPQELPLRTWCDRWRFRFEAAGIPAMGCRVFKVVPRSRRPKSNSNILAGAAAMQNEFLKVEINPNGTADVTDLEEGTVLKEQNLFHDRGDVGDPWIGAFPENDTIVTSADAKARISVIEEGPLSAAVETRVRMDLPVAATRDTKARKKETRPVNISTVYRLVKGERFVRITTTIDNTVEDHILTARFPTKVTTDTACAEVAFDVVERPIPHPDCTGWREPYKPVQPQQNFVDLSDGKRGVAVLNRGLPQYEAVDDDDRTIALTLLRCHKNWNSVRLAYYPDQPGTQLIGTHTFEYALMPHAGGWDDAGVIHEAEKLNVVPMVAAAGPGPGELSADVSFVELEGDGLVMNAFKRGEWDDSLIVRVSNPTTRDIRGAVTLHMPVSRAEAVNLMETEVRAALECVEGRISVELPAKKILTIRCRL